MLIFDKQRESYQIVGYKQFDSLEPLRATFLNNGQPISLIDYYVRFECKKPDGNIVIDDENINIRNVCEIEMLLNEQVAVVNGNVKCQFVLVRKNDERQTSTFDFEMNIQQSVIAINGYSHSTITIAERLNKDIPIAKKLHEDLTKDIADGNKTKQELIEKTTIAKTTINTLVEKTAEGNNTIDGLVEKDAIAKATDSKLNKTIDNANETNRILNESNSEADTTNARLQMTIDSGKDSIDKINATGNKSLIIGASQFINNEYTWKHDMNSEDLHVTFEDLATKLPLLPDYQRIDKNNILIRNSAESPNIKVVLSASYYQGNALFGTNVEEFASDSIGVNTKKVRLKDGNGIVENPVTDSDAVFMPDGTTKLTKKIDDISASLEQKAQNIKYIYSKIKADGITNDMPTLINEINSLKEYECLVTPKGVSVLSSAGNPNIKTNISLDFSATTFKKGSLSDTLIFKLNNSEVKGLTIDGNRDNQVFDDSKFGTDYLFKIDDNCKNVKFINTTLKNAPFCAVMLGQNLSDIYFNDLICENIGEHVFYKTGYIDINKNIENFICENIKLHNIGINPSNLTLGHTVQFIKIANVGDRTNVGYAKDMVLRNISLKQDDTYAFVNVFEIYDLRDSLADKVNGDFTSIYKCSKLDNVTCSNSKILRGFYTNASLISLNNIVFEQCVFTGHFPHVNFATTYKCCTFDKYMESSTTTALKNKILTFDNCIFNITASCSIDHVLTDIALINCSYKSKATTLVPSHMIGFGEKETIPSRLVTINGGYNDSVNFNFLFSFRHASLRVSLQNLIATGRIRTSVPIMNINMQNVFFNFDSGYYTPVLTDITATNTTFINVKTADGKSLDNYITGANGTFTDSAGKTITVINGVIKTIV